MKPSQTLIANPVVVLREEADDWAILFNPDTSEAVGINPVGVQTWKLINGRKKMADILGLLETRFQNVPESAAEEVASFLDELERMGFVATEPVG